MPTTVFWPAGVRVSGICYGWSKPAVCVAGVLQVDTEDEAESRLQTFRKSEQCDSLIRGSADVVVLGKCHFEQVNQWRYGTYPKPSLSLWPVKKAPCIIFYHRHSPRLLRFYSLDEYNFSAEGIHPKPSPYAKVVAVHPVSTPRDNTSERIDTVTICHFNISMAVELLLSQASPGPPHFLERMYSVLSGVCQPLYHPIVTCSRGLAVFCSFPATFVGSLCLKDISATAQQLDVRAEQAEYLVNEVGSLNKRAFIPLRRYSALYIGFYNIVWLLINDFAFGYSFGVFLNENSQVLATMLNRVVEDVLVQQVQFTLSWLDSWPAGLKLNTELSQFYAHTFFKLIALWGGVLREGGNYLPHIISAIGVMSFAGTTLLISSCMDLLSLMTLHLYICYVFSNFIYRKMLQTASSLWRLFRGKRYNVLRNRTDSWEYDMDQLIFGTILFTLLAFLFPTVLAYYTLFALLRFAIILLQACFETCLAFMNHFPLFALLLRLKDPWRLPGGIYFNKVIQPDWPPPVLVVENRPISLSLIFFQYVQLSKLLASYYNPLRLFYFLLSGQYLAAIPRYSIRYNKLATQGYIDSGSDYTQST